MKRAVLLAAVLLATVTVVMGCGPSTPSEEVALEDTEWVMESYGEAGNMQEALPGVEVTLHFDSTERGAGGNGGINHYGGKYQLDGNQLTFPEGVMTTCLGGNAAVLWQEEEYIGMLSSTDSFEIVDGKLHIICDDDMIVYHKK